LRGVRLAAVLVGIGALAAAPGVTWYFFLRKTAPPASAVAPFSRFGVHSDVTELPMAKLVLAFGLAALLSCGEVPEIRVGGRITYETIEDGFWAIHGDDGTVYDPRALGAEFQKDGLPVFATLVLRPDLLSIHMVGPIVDVVSMQVVPGFAGAWRGTKTYLTSDGAVEASAPGWVFEMRMIAPDALQFVNGPAAYVTGSSTFSVSGYTYPPSYPPGTNGQCVPIINVVINGSGTLAADGSLLLSVNWTHSCGGATSRSVTTYSMTWVAALAPGEFPEL
jgi:hypothetical protein